MAVLQYGVASDGTIDRCDQKCYAASKHTLDECACVCGRANHALQSENPGLLLRRLLDAEHGVPLRMLLGDRPGGGPCICGCGGRSATAWFCPGHDRRHSGQLGELVAAGVTALFVDGEVPV